MKNAFIFSAALALVSCSVAAPLEERARQPTFSIVASRPGSFIDMQPLNANGGSFWIGKPTSSYCPKSLGCPAGNSTSVIRSPNGSLAMNVEVPGGQRVYIDSKYGALHYTQAHSTDMPSGFNTRGFSLTHEEGQENSQVLLHNHQSDQFHACCGPDYQCEVVVKKPDDATVECLSFTPLATKVHGYGAWQYA